jgi:hypothetical protein
MVPSDLHFIIRHGLTGLMFLFFLLFGIWNIEVWARPGCDVARTLALDLAGQCTAVKVYSRLADLDWLVLAMSIIIGITLQGMQMVINYACRKLFKDKARRYIANRVMEVIRRDDIPDLKGEILKKYDRKFARVSRKRPDALYVWVYHSDADDKLVEWARRRRSYHYLGFHFATAFLIGTSAGVAVALLGNYPLAAWCPPAEGNLLLTAWCSPAEGDRRLQAVLQTFLVVCAAAWAVGALCLARPMKDDADAMELAWSCGRLHPGFRRAVFGDGPTPGAGTGTAAE